MLIGISGILLFMIAWRVKIAIISSRYALLLNVPFAFFSAYFLLNWKIRSLSAKSEKILRIAGILIAIGCLWGKFLRFDPNEKKLFTLYQTIRDDFPKNPDHVIFDTTHKNKTLYYLEEKTTTFFPWKWSPEQMAQFFQDLRYSNRTIYWIAIRLSSDKDDWFDKQYATGNNTRLFHDYISRRKKKELIAGRFQCHRNIGTATTGNPAEAVFLEDFEHGKVIEKNSYTYTLFQKNSLSLIPFDTQTVSSKIVLCPMGWGTPSQAAYYRTDRDPIHGQWSFFLHGERWISFVTEETFPRGSYRLSLFVKALQNSEMRLGIRYQEGNETVNKQIAYIHLSPADGTQGISFDITPADCPVSRFHLLLLSNFGSMVIDDVMMQRIPEKLK